MVEKFKEGGQGKGRGKLKVDETVRTCGYSEVPDYIIDERLPGTRNNT